METEQNIHTAKGHWISKYATETGLQRLLKPNLFTNKETETDKIIC